MHEYILTVFLVNEAVPFSVIKPFNRSYCQSSDLLSSVAKLNQTFGRYAGKGTVPSSEIDLIVPDRPARQL